MNFTTEQLEFCRKVRESAREIRVADLVNLFIPDIDRQPGRILRRLAQLEIVLDVLNFRVEPSIADGDLASIRLVSTRINGVNDNGVLQEIRSGEGQKLEFKSSFSCSIRAFRSNVNIDPSHLRSIEVEDSAFKAIAGLMNADGGVILVGVEDSGDILGLNPDYVALNVSTPDRWLLYFRSKLENAFIEGRIVSGHVDVTFIELAGNIIARMIISPRKKLVFLKNHENPKCAPKLLLRRGNQTVEVKSDELEDFFIRRLQARAS